jgi:sulfate adenylyltransferase subunit 2
MSTLTKQTLSHLDWLEAEAIHIMREVAGQCSNPVLLFSGGKDSICMLRLAEKAFRPGKFPFPLVHIDTGHNYPEVTAFRDKRAAELGERLIVRSVEDSMARGTVVLKHAGESRNKHQSVTLLEAIAEFGFDACIGGARRDEEKARAKERVFSSATSSANGTRRTSARSCGTSTTPASTRARTSAPSRSPTGPNWTSGSTSSAKARTALDLLRPHAPGGRAPQRRHGAGDPPDAHPARKAAKRSRRAGALPHRRRHHLHGAGRVDADTVEKIIAETATTTITERGATRLDDQTSEASMEQRKKEGYF